MSQFDFPRINFHGQALLDTPTANNGYIPNVTIFNQDESGVFMPPRIMFDPSACTPPPGATVYQDGSGNSYINPLNITIDNFQQWCTTPLGSFAADASYASFYQCITASNNGNGPYGMNPGYWNYYGDISMALNNVVVTGITIPNGQNLPLTYTQNNISQCPAALAPLMGAAFSFNNDYFTPGSRTTAFLCDVDSEGQLCTQIFYGQGGLYKVIDGENVTFFKGHPVKSTVRFMNLLRVLNYANITPMGGSASFYTTVEDNSSELVQLFAPYASGPIIGLSIKILIHEVHEVRFPDYTLMPGVSVPTASGGTVTLPKNPAQVSITGSITPYYANDMKTTSICRILKNPFSSTIAINSTGIDNPVPQGKNSGIGIPPLVNLAPVPFIVHNTLNLVSLDLSNILNEYGENPGTIAPYAGTSDIPPYQDFVSYNYGTFTLMFQPDSSSAPLVIGNITYDDDYNMDQFIATGGMVDIQPPDYDYASGYFYISLGSESQLLVEDKVYITTDQQGIYAEQSNTPTNVYLSDGFPLVPCTLRVFSRGIAISSMNPFPVTVQAVNMLTGNTTTNNVNVYDGMQYTFPVNQDGCTTYIFPTNANENIYNGPGLLQNAYMPMNACLIVCRVLSANPELAPYLNGTEPITWDVLFTNVLQLYKTIYPVMDVILPINEQTWSDPFIQQKILMLSDESNWNQPMFMPITRDMSAAQRQLLHMWISQSQQSPKQQASQYE